MGNKLQTVFNNNLQVKRHKRQRSYRIITQRSLYFEQLLLNLRPDTCTDPTILIIAQTHDLLNDASGAAFRVWSTPNTHVSTEIMSDFNILNRKVGNVVNLLFIIATNQSPMMKMIMENAMLCLNPVGALLIVVSNSLDLAITLLALFTNNKRRQGVKLSQVGDYYIFKYLHKQSFSFNIV